jgi:hypothetical protein
VVVVVPEDLDDPGRPGQARIRANEDADGSGGDEEVDERLGKSPVYLPSAERRTLAAVAARIVDVDVEPVLVRDVPRAEVPATRTAEVADAEARGAGVASRVAIDDREYRADEPVRSPTPPAPVRLPVEERIPREEQPVFGRQLDAAQKPTFGRAPQRLGSTPLNLGVGPGGIVSRPRERAGEPAGDGQDDDQAE